MGTVFGNKIIGKIMFENWYNAAYFVHLALLFQAAGFLIRDELWLRILLLIGTGFYLLYYFLFPAEPLWDAIFASSTLAIINSLLIIIIIRERTLFAMSQQEVRLYRAFETLSPGQFRKLLRLGNWTTATSGITLTTEDRPLSKLYFITEGKLAIRKDAKLFTINESMFVGELAFLLSANASATVTAEKGAVYIEWKVSELKKLFQKSRNLENAMIALFNLDLARKVSNSVGKVSVDISV